MNISSLSWKASVSIPVNIIYRTRYMNHIGANEHLCFMEVISGKDWYLFYAAGEQSGHHDNKSALATKFAIMPQKSSLLSESKVCRDLTRWCTGPCLVPETSGTILPHLSYPLFFFWLENPTDSRSSISDWRASWGSKCRLKGEFCCLWHEW